MRNRVVLTVTWLLAVAAAMTVALLAVRLVDDAVLGRGPLGDDVGAAEQVVSDDATPQPNPSARVVSAPLTNDFGTFVVSCQGAFARGVEATANEAEGWRVVRIEPGPDDDVDAVFARADELVEMEVFCNRGQPEIGEIERSRLTDEDDDGTP